MIDFDNVCLHLLMNSTEYCSSVCTQIDEDMLIDYEVQKHIFKTIQNYFNEHNKRPSPIIVEENIDEKIRSREDFKDIWSDISKIKYTFSSKEDEYINELDSLIDLTEEKYKQ